LIVDPNYSQQLDAIIKALSRPSVPTWLIAILSAALGFVAAVLSQICQHLLADGLNRQKMRRVIYPELGSMYSRAHHFCHLKTDRHSDDANEWKRTRLAASLHFESEKYAKENLATYLQLREYPQIDLVYDVLRSATNDDGYGFDINCGLAVEVIEDMVRLGDIPAKYIKKYMGKEDAKKLLARRNTIRVGPKIIVRE